MSRALFLGVQSRTMTGKQSSLENRSRSRNMSRNRREKLQKELEEVTAIAIAIAIAHLYGARSIFNIQHSTMFRSVGMQVIDY